MPSPLGSDVCLVTAVTEDFLPGALVTIGSFLKHHPCFGGDVIVVHDGLAKGPRGYLKTAFERVRFDAVSPALRERLTRLAAACPRLAPKLPHFWSLEAFRIGGYRKVLFCDCDLLFRQPIDGLFDSEEELLCCGESSFLNDRHRDAATFGLIKDRSRAGAVLERTFNSGLLLIDAQLTGQRTYSELLALVSPETWRGTETFFTDQFVLNRYFAGRQTLVNSTYNYILHAASTIRTREGLAVGDAKVLHFTGSHKPWMPQAMLRWMLGRAQPTPALAYRLWYDAWMSCLETAHLRAVSSVARNLEGGHAG